MKVEKISSAYAPVDAVSRINVKIDSSVQSGEKRDAYTASSHMASFEEKFALAQECGALADEKGGIYQPEPV